MPVAHAATVGEVDVHRSCPAALRRMPANRRIPSAGRSAYRRKGLDIFTSLEWARIPTAHAAVVSAGFAASAVTEDATSNKPPLAAENNPDRSESIGPKQDSFMVLVSTRTVEVASYFDTGIRLQCSDEGTYPGRRPSSVPWCL